ncbi:hypothetical protein K445DRAFT_12372 [Daldinia sp. EC12]|nr:hypothetical protein K445DRAFT_12372 [Daldinia sp. EC12]
MDPLSISAGVAGFISLGLTATGGIIQYCKSYRSRDADLTQLMHHAKELESFLSSIQDRTTTSQIPSRDIDSSLQGCRNACDACLSDFKNLNAQYTNGKLLRRLKYPFDKASFDDIRSRLQEFHARLLGFLQLINLDATRDIRSITISESAKITRTVESVGRDVQSSLSDVKQVVTSTIHTGINQLESSFQHDLGETETHLTSSIHDNHRALSSQVSLITINQESQLASIRQYIDHHFRVLQNNQQELISRTVAASAEVNDAEEFIKSNTANYRWVRRSVREKMNLGMSEQNIFDSLCTCPKIPTRRSTKEHQDGCIYALKRRESWSFNRKFRVFRRVITIACRFEYARMNWARDWRVYPNMTVRMTVPWGSPAFEVIYDASFLFGKKETIQETEELFRDCLIQIKEIFINGEGWPTDVEEGGFNLIHVCLLSFPSFS